MKTARELFTDNDYWTYHVILEQFGDILVQVDDDDYQGDSRVLYQQENRFGYLQFGWGSCSGCDALEACNTVDEVQELMDELYQSIIWFDNWLEVLAYFENHDWEGDYSWRSKEQKDFIQKVINHYESKFYKW